MDTQVEITRDSNDFWFACVDIDVLRNKDLSPMAKYIFAVACTFASVMVGRYWPSIDTVANTANVSPREVMLAYKELADKGILTQLQDRCEYCEEEIES
ncbi:MAG: helix-turn-helix domain-containing protein [Synergistaceae bacterium]|nr:helix-turn-helix domain-containing protein [Synergistaceae bacterium]